MSAVLITEIIANHGKSFAFTVPGRALATGRRCPDGSFRLRMADRSEYLCVDFDAARDHILTLLSGQPACFQKRRITARRSVHH